MEFILIGQPNSGKSTIFNEVVGYKAVSSNFPSSTIKYTKGKIEFRNQKIDVTDLPGTYSSQTMDETELLAVKYIRNASKDSVIINVVDASVLSRSLELTIQIMTIQRPMVIALNMIDEAEQKGINIDADKLSRRFGVPVVKTIGRKGTGVYELFSAAYEIGISNHLPLLIKYEQAFESYLERISSLLRDRSVKEKWNYRFIALKLIEKDELINEFLHDYLNEKDREQVRNIITEAETQYAKKSEFISSGLRHALAFEIFNEVAQIGSPLKKDFRRKLDDVLMHPFFGYVFMALILYAIFSLIFFIGHLVEPVFLDNFHKLLDLTANEFGRNTITYSVIAGIISGFGGGIGIVIPYLLPFFILLAFLEDTGYLTRIAYLIDNVMHKIGLHGLSVIPIVLGYGCTVPGILATRVLKSPRDKLITATLTTLVPCSAKMTIIFGLVGFFISMEAAVTIYVLNLIVIGITGKFISKAMPEISPGLVLEIPRYHLPHPGILLTKTWFRMKEFVVIAWPLLIVGSICLEVINHFDLTESINQAFSPFTAGVLGLPAAVGVTILFGILRKELALILLFSALGTNNILDSMTIVQIFSFTIFITFYIPCLATFAALTKELSFGKAISITVLVTGIAISLAVLIRFLLPLIIV